ncbi:ATP-binding protein [Fictibacillus sp. BK138]|uniref:ATP-binding protein n=1 Tax=Fictibacillus sp. BK138 TaxID=2512121 RepID=UPI001028B362|nr:ATP-binding protein [Fictibacillus sp. BK138]RZT21561.1 PAS domain S-box-containing protein [Fictibacillus sp. BK138]
MDHNLYIVILSLFVCFLFALVSIEWAQRRSEEQKMQQRFLILGSVTMGIAVWATHFMGMLSIQSPVTMYYDLQTMLLAFAAGILFSYVSFYLLQYNVQKLPKKIWAPVIIFGFGLILVHSIGLLSMHVHMPLQTDLPLILLSFSSAFFFSWVGFRILLLQAFKFRLIIASLSLTSGVSLMHYIGEMALVGGTPTFNWHNEFPLTNINILSTLLVLGATSIVLILYILEQLDQKKIVQQRIELLESEHRYNSLFDLNPEGVFVIGPDQNFIKANKSIESITGYSFEELQKMPYTNLLKENQIENSLNFLKRVMEGETVKHPLTIHHKDGHEVELEITSLPYSIKNTITAVIGIAKDMTAVKESHEYKQRAQTLTYVGELAAGLAHEIRNPLTSIKGFAQLFKSQDETNEKDHFLGIMLRETERINFIISQLMILARPHMIIKKDHDLNALINRSLKFMDDEGDFHTTTFQLNLPDQPVDFHCEENLMTQLFLNVLKNSLEAIPSWGTITVTLTQSDETIQISMKDDGPGIPEDILPMLGQPFYTTKDSNPGLGLMICYQIVENHGGKIHIESKEGSGTTVSMEFPNNVARGEAKELEMTGAC